MGAFPGLGPVDFPTLGWDVINWMEQVLATPDNKGGLLRLTDEQARIFLEVYRLREDGSRRYRRGVLMTPKGWGTSPTLAAWLAAEALGPVVFDGWDSKGRPVGKPWSRVRTPLLQAAAASEGQASFVYDSLLEMLRDGPATDLYPGLEPLDGFVRLPVGKIMPITAAAISKEGARAVAVAFDQTESWLPSNGGIRLASTLRRNAAKVDGFTFEGPNAFVPGEGSVAEESHRYYEAIKAGTVRNDGLLYIYREAPSTTDLSDEQSLREGLSLVYGDAAAWTNIERIMLEIWDPATDPADAARFYLNQQGSAGDAWLSSPEWGSCQIADQLEPDDLIALGFDGSRKRERGVTDATALVACRLRDGFITPIQVWEQPDGPLGDSWEVPTKEVDVVVHETFTKYRVAAFFADPAKWESYIDQWEAKYNKTLKVKSSSSHPIQWWMTGKRTWQVVTALKRFYEAVLTGELSHSGSSVLTRHVLNARRRATRSGLTIAKDSPSSPRKIDAAVAAVLAFEARNACIAAGVLEAENKPKKSNRVYRF